MFLYIFRKEDVRATEKDKVFFSILSHILTFSITILCKFKFFTIQSTDTHSDSLFSLHSRLKCTSVLDLEILLLQKLYPFNLNHRKSSSVSKNFTSSIYKNIPQFMIAFTWRCPFLYTQYSRKWTRSCHSNKWSRWVSEQSFQRYVACIFINEILFLTVFFYLRCYIGAHQLVQDEMPQNNGRRI